MNITVDLIADWSSMVRQELNSYGYQTASMDDERVACTYFNLTKRLIPSAPRAVLRSKEFSCPEELMAGLRSLESKIRSGEDLAPYLSRGLKKANYNDALLNHWGIHHLHLGTEVESDGFIARTGPVLFVLFAPVTAYLITVATHGSWTLQEFIRILHRNWPESIARFRLHGAENVAVEHSDNDVTDLRQAMINAPVKAEPGVVYGLPGGGVTMTGLSTEVRLQVSAVHMQLQQLEKMILNRAEEIKEMAGTRGVGLPADVNFRLEYDSNGQHQVVETTSRFIVEPELLRG